MSVYGESALAVAVTVNFSLAFLAVFVAATSKYFNTVAAVHVLPKTPGTVSPFLTVRAAPELTNFTALSLPSAVLSV